MWTEKKKSSQIYMELQAQTSIYTQYFSVAAYFFVVLYYTTVYIFFNVRYFLVCARSLPSLIFHIYFLGFYFIVCLAGVTELCEGNTAAKKTSQREKPAKQY